MPALKLISDRKHKCSDCGKPYVKKGALTNPMKNVHAKHDSPETQGFLDNTAYSDLDKDETIIRNHALAMNEVDLFQDVIMDQSDDGNFGFPSVSGFGIFFGILAFFVFWHHDTQK